MKKILRKLILFLLFIVICVGAYYTAAGYVMYKKATQNMSVTEKVKEVRTRDKYVVLDEIPDIYEDAVISAEDHRFYRHRGVDFFSFFRAMVKNIQAGEIMQGGSTITQQLAKNLFFTHEQNIERKIAELFVVYQLEDEYAKDVILELYINTVYYGDGYYCIYDAAKGYFGALPSEMTDYECTLLAGVPNAPSIYAPTKNKHLAQQRQEHVLDRMVECNALSVEEKQQILQQKK